VQRGNEQLGSIKCGEYFDKLRTSLFPKMHCSMERLIE
jgi:hypothetical protein